MRGVKLGARVEWVWVGKLGLALVVLVQNGLRLGRGGCEWWRDLRLGLTVLSGSATGGTRLFVVCMTLVYVSREEITGGWGSEGSGRGTSNVSGSAIRRRARWVPSSKLVAAVNTFIGTIACVWKWKVESESLIASWKAVGSE